MNYTMTNPTNTVIDETAVIGENTVIEPFCTIGKNVVIGRNCLIGSFSYLADCTVGDRTEIRSSRITNSRVGANCAVGPNAHLRQNSVVADHCRVGNYVELKNSVLGRGSKASHLAYIGDATVGENCNVGCGAIFVNYDGKQKHQTVVGNDVFIGSNCNLIAPLQIADGTFIACSTTVTQNTNPNDMIIGRVNAIVKPDRSPLSQKKDRKET